MTAFVHRGTFHSVGQGLFHSARVDVGSRTFNYIYDCGASRPGRYLAASIASIYERKIVSEDNLTFLFLSHLHWDHVSGLDALLQGVPTVDVVVMPYLCPAERAMAIALAIDDFDFANSGHDWYPDFLRRPGRYLLNRGIKRVLFVRGSDPVAQKGVQMTHPPVPGGDFQNAFLEWNNLDELSQSSRDAIEEAEKDVDGDFSEKGVIEDERVGYHTSQGALGIGSWTFTLFNVEPTRESLDLFVQQFEVIRNGDALEKVLRSPARLRLVKKP